MPVGAAPAPGSSQRGTHAVKPPPIGSTAGGAAVYLAKMVGFGTFERFEMSL